MVQRSGFPHGGRSAAVGVAAAGIAVLAAVLVAVVLPRDTTPPAAPAPATSRTGSASPTSSPDRDAAADVGDRLRGPTLPASRPVTIRVRRLGLDQPLVRLGIDETGALEPPRRPEDVGWFTGSVTPGETGPAVLAGHVTWNGARAVFFRLGAMRPGDRVEVGRADGRTAVFAVTAVERFAKQHFPTRRVYGSAERAVLRLITCGGRYDADRHRYADNVVVFARLVGTR